MARLTDISEHQQRPSIRRLKDEDNIVGVGVKMSEGWGYVDPDGVYNLRNVVDLGLVPIAYHFNWSGAPEGKGGKHQAEFLLRQIAKVVSPIKVIPAADVEISSSMTRANFPTFRDIRLFLGTLEDKRPGQRVGLYSGYYWRGNLGNPRIADLGLKRRPIIWDAHYFHSTNAPASSFADKLENVPDHYFETQAFGGLDADMLQFSDRVRFSAYTGDANVTNVDLAGLREWTKAA